MTEIVSKQWGVFLFPFVHPPFSIVVFMPLRIFDTLETAAVVHLWALVAVLYLSAALIARRNPGFLDFGGFVVLAIVVFLLGATLTRRVPLIGQLEWFVLALVLLAFEFRARAVVSGVFLSPAGLLARLGFEGQLPLVFAAPAGLSLAVLILRDRELTALHIANALCLIPLLPSVSWPSTASTRSLRPFCGSGPVGGYVLVSSETSRGRYRQFSGTSGETAFTTGCGG